MCRSCSCEERSDRCSERRHCRRKRRRRCCPKNVVVNGRRNNNFGIAAILALLFLGC
ncbi:hypothetical protein [Clostridium omnivorum]|uniref:hypothetical protein n=1 Tax=Clostridium omnivorum TaxID=1604902 RepID=UPI002232BB41|nr:hypothetical protein [Clostridium sp. E14]